MAGDLKAACNGLAILAADGKPAKTMNREAFVDQVANFPAFGLPSTK